ncbi:MAG TPA: HAMP domain-containing sensor histidine kinase [Chroococcales cyanobacterium]
MNKLGKRVWSSYFAAIAVMLLSLALVVMAFRIELNQTGRIRGELDLLEKANQMIYSLEKMENVEFLYFYPSQNLSSRKGEFDREAASFKAALRAASTSSERNRERLAPIEKEFALYRALDDRIYRLVLEGRIAAARDLNLNDSMELADRLRNGTRDFHSRTAEILFRDQALIDRILWDTEGWLILVFLGGAAFAGILWRRAVLTLEELRSLDKMKSDLMAVISHELLTPINFITGYGSTLEDGVLGPLTEEQQRAVKRILEGASRLTRLVGKVLDYTLLEAGKMVIQNEELDYRALLGPVVEETRCAARLKSQDFHFSCPEGPLMVRGDPQRLQQVLSELLENAQKFTAEKGRIGLKVWEEGDRIFTEVFDSGEGISLEEVKSLFKPFYQLDLTSTRRHGGIGIGLAIVKYLVAAMGGEISVSSKPGEGTRVLFTLPKPSERPNS